VKVDQGFLNAMIGMFASGETNEQQIKAAFKADCQLLDKTLLADADAMSSSATVVKNYYDELHFSPLKVRTAHAFINIPVFQLFCVIIYSFSH